MTTTREPMTPADARRIAQATDAACEAIGNLCDAVRRLSEAFTSLRVPVRLERGPDDVPVWHWEPDPADLNPVRGPGNL